MSGAPHGNGGAPRHSPYVIFFVALYTVTAIGLGLASYYIGGPITGGWCVWGIAVLATLFFYMLFSGTSNKSH